MHTRPHNAPPSQCWTSAQNKRQWKEVRKFIRCWLQNWSQTIHLNEEGWDLPTRACNGHLLITAQSKPVEKHPFSTEIIKSRQDRAWAYCKGRIRREWSVGRLGWPYQHTPCMFLRYKKPPRAERFPQPTQEAKRWRSALSEWSSQHISCHPSRHNTSHPIKYLASPENHVK